MAGRRHQRVEPLRALERAVWRLRRLDCVNVVMIGADVLRIAAQHTLEHRYDLLSAFRRFTGRRPELPRVEVHQAFRVERCGVEVVGILTHDVSHGVLYFTASAFRSAFGSSEYRTASASTYARSMAGAPPSSAFAF